MRTPLMWFLLSLPLALLFGADGPGVAEAASAAAYQGHPYGDAPQRIPGRVQIEQYDRGGEGIAFHDTDESNVGKWRKDEAVDCKAISPFDKRLVALTQKRGDQEVIEEPDQGAVYVGWTFDGEWLCYTVEIAEAGIYVLSAHMTVQNRGVAYSFWLDGKDLTGPIPFQTTHHPHRWWVYEDFAEVELPAGVHVLKRLNHGPHDRDGEAEWMGNTNYVEFRLKGTPRAVDGAGQGAGDPAGDGAAGAAVQQDIEEKAGKAAAPDDS